jgi:hypothetical protein
MVRKFLRRFQYDGNKHSGIETCSHVARLESSASFNAVLLGQSVERAWGSRQSSDGASRHLRAKCVRGLHRLVGRT